MRHCAPKLQVCNPPPVEAHRIQPEMAIKTVSTATRDSEHEIYIVAADESLPEL